MDVIPLRFIMHEDASVVGKELADLASLKRLNFPVPDGIVLFPPHIPFTSILKTYLSHDKQRFEQSIEIIRSQFFAIPVPESLTEELKMHRLDQKQVWKDALQTWLIQMRSKVWREGVSEKIVEELSPIPIFFTGTHNSAGDAYFDPEDRSIKIRVSKGELSDKDQSSLTELVEKLRKKVLAHYILHWVRDEKGIHIIRAVEFTHAVSDKNFEQEIEVKSYRPEAVPSVIKTGLKLFADLSDGLSVERDVDGIFLASERIETDDRKILKLVESGMVMDDYVIFQLSNQKSKDDVSSTLRLIHQPELVQKELNTFLFAKHNYAKQKKQGEFLTKQPLLHLQLGIPKIVSVGELQELKKLMRKFGVERKGNTKFWVELSVPENWIHLKQYLEEGIDGIIVDLDELYGALIGVEQYAQHPFYQFSAEVVLSFLQQFIKQVKIPILFKSERILDDEVIKFCIKEGVFGVILNRIQLGGAREYVARFEKRILVDRKGRE